VYFFLDARTELLYVGKATDVRKRLQQHARSQARTTGARLRAMYARVADVRWVVTVDEDEAATREADLIVALQPAFNASYTDQGRWVFISCRPAGDGAATEFGLVDQPECAPARTYGCFPHLGRGVSSRPAIACSDGYAALLRSLWAAAPVRTQQYPARIAGPSPPDQFAAAVEPGLQRALHAFLSGTSRRLLDALAARHRACDAYMQPALTRDRESAEALFRAGPQALRHLRLRHALAPGPVPRRVIEQLLFEEMCAAIGEFRLPARDDPTAGLLGARTARTVSLGLATRRVPRSG
jgi:predicted GIY-YIG superfamily endonuclease